MSKEAEAAVKRIRNTIAYLGRKSGKTRYFEDINLIIEQSERVHELEEDNKNLQVLSSINRKEHMRIHEQNNRYREALNYIKQNTPDFHLYSIIETALRND